MIRRQSCNFYTSSSTYDNVISQMQENEYKLRRAHWEGKGGIACCLNIPKVFVERMGLDKQSYLKVTYLQDEQMLIVQKLVDNGGYFESK
jgi:hypothetical protein